MRTKFDIADVSNESQNKRSFGTVASMLVFTFCVAMMAYDAVLLVSKQGSLSKGGVIVNWLASFHSPIDHTYSPWLERVDSFALLLTIITPIGWFALIVGMVFLIWSGKFSVKSKIAYCVVLGLMCLVFFDALTVVLD